MLNYCMRQNVWTSILSISFQLSQIYFKVNSTSILQLTLNPAFSSSLYFVSLKQQLYKQIVYLIVMLVRKCMAIFHIKSAGKEMISHVKRIALSKITFIFIIYSLSLSLSCCFKLVWFQDEKRDVWQNSRLTASVIIIHFDSFFHAV